MVMPLNEPACWGGWLFIRRYWRHWTGLQLSCQQWNSQNAPRHSNMADKDYTSHFIQPSSQLLTPDARGPNHTHAHTHSNTHRIYKIVTNNAKCHPRFCTWNPNPWMSDIALCILCWSDLLPKLIPISSIVFHITQKSRIPDLNKYNETPLKVEVPTCKLGETPSTLTSWRSSCLTSYNNGKCRGATQCTW